MSLDDLPFWYEKKILALLELLKARQIDRGEFRRRLDDIDKAYDDAVRQLHNDLEP